MPKFLTMHPAIILILAAINNTAAFSPVRTPFVWHRSKSAMLAGQQSLGDETTKIYKSVIDSLGEDANEADEFQYKSTSVRAPLKFIGPYPCLALRFPNLATSSQRARNVTGVSLDFVLDTAANTNTLNGQVAQELQLPVVGAALPGFGAGGTIQGGATFLLGDSQLEGVPAVVVEGEKTEPFTFMQNLTASVLPVASPACAGLLSLSFFYCFEGGVEFDWKGKKDEELPPSVTFYGQGESDNAIQEMTRVSIKELPVTRLPSIQITINGVTLPALLDTGSPITVINAQAAEKAGIETVDILGGGEEKDGNKKNAINPLANIGRRFKEAQAKAQAAARGDLLTIAGARGERVDLIKSKLQASLAVLGADPGTAVNFGNSHVYVGNLPGLAAMNALGDDSPPAAVLGMDVLRLLPKMLFRPRNHEVYF